MTSAASYVFVLSCLTSSSISLATLLPSIPFLPAFDSDVSFALHQSILPYYHCTPRTEPASRELFNNTSKVNKRRVALLRLPSATLTYSHITLHFTSRLHSCTRHVVPEYPYEPQFARLTRPVHHPLDPDRVLSLHHAHFLGASDRSNSGEHAVPGGPVASTGFRHFPALRLCGCCRASAQTPDRRTRSQ